MLFPIFSFAYILAPHSSFGQTMRKPFIKFICHSASYFTFLCKYQACSGRITFITKLVTAKAAHAMTLHVIKFHFNAVKALERAKCLQRMFVSHRSPFSVSRQHICSIKSSHHFACFHELPCGMRNRISDGLSFSHPVQHAMPYDIPKQNKSYSTLKMQ